MKKNPISISFYPFKALCATIALLSSMTTLGMSFLLVHHETTWFGSQTMKFTWLFYLLSFWVVVLIILCLLEGFYFLYKLISLYLERKKGKKDSENKND